MRIAMLAAGNAIHTARWVNALADRGLEVHLFSMHEFRSDISARVHTIRLPIPAPAGYFANGLFLNQQLSAFRFDLLHAHYASGYGTLGRLAKTRPKVLSVWGSDVYCFPRKSSFHRKLLAANLRSADRVCSTSRDMAAETKRICPGIGDIAITPFGVDLQRFVPRRAPANVDTVVIGTIKSLSATYGIDTLIRGFAACRQQLEAKCDPLARRLRLKIGGSGPDRAPLERLAHACGVADATEFLGTVPHADVPIQLKSFDIFVAVSRSESFGVSVVEASACELPVVVSNVGGLPEVVEHGETGFVIPAESPMALAESLKRLAKEPELRMELGKAGRRFVQRHYPWDESVTRMIDIYRETCVRRAVAS